MTLVTLLSFQASAAQPSINEMQTCQGMIDFVILKLEKLPSKYNENDVKIVQKGLGTYNRYIQNTYVTPGLLKYTQGKNNEANALPKQVDVYKEKVVKSYQNQYPYNKLSIDFAVFINKCTQKAVPAGNDLAALKASLLTLVELVKKQ
jgi:hypothetical protein